MAVLIIAWLFLSGMIGVHLAGKRRVNRGTAFFAAVLLGPIAWIAILIGPDNNPRCPECRGIIGDGARRCMHCGVVFPQPLVVTCKCGSLLDIMSDGRTYACPDCGTALTA